MLILGTGRMSENTYIWYQNETITSGGGNPGTFYFFLFFHGFFPNF